MVVILFTRLFLQYTSEVYWDDLYLYIFFFQKNFNFEYHRRSLEPYILDIWKFIHLDVENSLCDTYILMYIREIGRIDPKDLERDASGTRCYSDFFVELASRIPEHILPNISLLLCHLDTEVSFRA